MHIVRKLNPGKYLIIATSILLVTGEKRERVHVMRAPKLVITD